MVRFHDGNPDKRYYRRFKIKNVSGIDDCKMMREVIQRRFCKAKDKDNMLGNLPDLILIDGGKGQLSASFEALKEIGFGDIPILGLAKRLEEIFTVYGQDPICLPHDAQALHVLQRIRDEAHRFAISYHRKLRDLRIRESVLDDVDGIGSAKKRILIRHFGSIHQLKKANVQQIAEMKGINLKLAEKIYRALH
ncbi:MAG: helix-hairpin-helix domain-containing protein, partial [Chlamydiota bacterium]|nr:helix-hairpin-helix domain-containing protein [Chlamydiota bacterium]